jgi:hypothetical protein
MEYLFIPGNVPSSKNSNQWTGKFLVKSKTTRKYISNTEDYWMTLRTSFQELFTSKNPLRVGLYFVRDSKRRFDYINACQIIADLMVKNYWIEDDNADFFLPVFLGYSYAKQNTGVYIVPQPSAMLEYSLEPDFTRLIERTSILRDLVKSA